MTPLEKTLQTALDTMARTNAAQARQIQSLTSMIEALNETVTKMTSEQNKLLAYVEWLKRKVFGYSSERRMFIDSQPNLFDSAGVEIEGASQTRESISDELDEEDCGEAVVKKRKGAKVVSRGRLDISRLPVLETRVIEPEGGVDLSRYRRIGEEKTELLEHVPGKLGRIVIIRPKYGLIDPTEPVERGQGVLIAPMPPLPVPKGLPAPGLLTEILLGKYEYHMPFYRQLKQFAHLGIEGLREATLVGWFRRSMELLRPLYNVLLREIMKSDYIQADETTVPVMGKGSHHAEKEYLWMVRSVMEGLVAFHYDQGSRSGDVIKELTEKYNYKGYLQCDGFGGYERVFRGNASIPIVNCMVHIRRYWEPALKENRNEALWVLGKIRELYKVEKDCDMAGMDFEARRRERLLRTKPIMDEMKSRLEEMAVRYSPKTLTGSAAAYAYKRWDNMMRILEDGRLLLDNNLGENEIRPITLGRKNYLFCGNHDAASDMSVITSLLSTCRNHRVNPRLYLKNVLERMPYFMDATEDQIAELLPHRWKLIHPEAVMTQPVRQLVK